MNKKILTLFIIMIVAASAITFVSASDTHKINGEEFKIPAGFEYDEELSNEYCTEYEINNSTAAIFTNDYNEAITIAVIDSPIAITLDELNDGYPEKTIEDKKGFIESDDESVLFEYVVNDKIVMIESPNESVIESVLNNT